MALQTIPGTDVQYYLINFDEDGLERREGNSAPLSETVRALLGDRANGITDVFLASHGWKGDVPAAIAQCDRWMGEMVRSPDLATLRQRRPGFRALNIGIHWPSLPFGDENVLTDRSGATLSLGDADDADDIDRRVNEFAATLADTPDARQAIRTILEAAHEDDGTSAELPWDVQSAYRTLFAEAQLDGGEDDTLGAAPGDDHPVFDADEMYRAARDAGTASAYDTTVVDQTLGIDDALDRLRGLFASPMQQASFWKMKNRARVVGETGVHRLLVILMNAAAPETRFHLMGHSFGCIVMSAAVAGAPGGAPLPHPVDTLFLVQGALSLWSFAPDIPFAPGTPGYFNRILTKRLVRGPIVTTRSTFDRAVGLLYPPAARAKSQLVLGDEFPKYGGVGAYGAQGLGTVAIDGVMQGADSRYAFESGRVYNLEASTIICNGGGFSGAHSDIAHPEVAHTMWEAIAASEGAAH